MPTYTKGKIYKLQVSALQPDPGQARKFMDPASLAEMTASIVKHGVLQPILFRVDEKGALFIVAGERRVAAAKAAGLTTIPGILVDGNHREISLVENLLRENLTAVEEAEALEMVMKECKYSQNQLSEMIGKAQSVISQTLTLNNLPENVREQCRTNPNIPRTVLLDIASLQSPAAMQSKFKRYMDGQRKPAQAPAKKPAPSDARTFLKKMDVFRNELSSLAWQDWTEAERNELARRLRDIYNGTGALLEAMGLSLAQ